MKKITFLGCGNMGAAIATALADKGNFAITLFDKDKDKADELASLINAKSSETAEEALKDASYILIAVKPQILPSLYPLLRKHNDKKIISIAAGVPLEVLEREIGAKDIVRFMPNIAAKCKRAVTAVAFKTDSSKEFEAEALEIASAFGSAFPLEENLFPAFIGISGSAIAYVFEFIHALAMGGCEAGIPYNQSVEIARDTLLSACALQEQSKENPVALMTKVCSAAGTTIKGMHALSAGAFDDTVINAVMEACKKSIELEKSAKERK